jgi:L-alanine-DL-glutamate epimerase-like enolase superfamily enzyme
MTAALARGVDAPIESVEARAYRIPTDSPESDGTLEWDATTMVYVEVRAGDETGVGYTYADASAANVVSGLLAPALHEKDGLATARRYAEMIGAVRNNGRGGICAMAISAVDLALWDLKAKMRGVPLFALLGAARESVAAYGSGGFTSYSERELQRHMTAWTALGLERVKMKIGREPERDPQRVAGVRKAIGHDVELFVDANGAYDVKQALAMAERFAGEGVSWFEEPVYHRDLRGNARVRRRAPAGMEVSNGEYGYAAEDFAAIADAGAADVLQADVTRCGGISGFMAVDDLCTARFLPLSSHCAPSATLHAALAARQLRHVEYFYDHMRIERMLFDGAAVPANGCLAPDPSRPALGIELKRADAEEYAA